MKKPKKNTDSTQQEKIQWLVNAVEKARTTGDNKYAWEIVDFLNDTMILTQL